MRVTQERPYGMIHVYQFISMRMRLRMRPLETNRF